jgi:hypothetical protein
MRLPPCRRKCTCLAAQVRLQVSRRWMPQRKAFSPVRRSFCRSLFATTRLGLGSGAQVREALETYVWLVEYVDEDLAEFPWSQVAQHAADGEAATIIKDAGVCWQEEGGCPMKTRGTGILILGLALLILAGCCGRPVALGERFTLWQGEMVRVQEAGLIIEIDEMVYQQPGSQTPGDGFVGLRVTERGGRETMVTLFAGQEAQVGEYEIRLEKLVVGVESDGCELVVTR